MAAEPAEVQAAFAASIAAAEAAETAATPAVAIDSGEEAEEETGEEEAKPVAEQPEVTIASLKELFAQGNLKALARALGEDPGIVKASAPKIRAARAILNETSAKAKKAADDAARADQVMAGAKQVYGHIVAARQAAKAGDWLAAKEALEKHFELPYEQIASGIALASKGVSPEVAQLRRQLREREQADNARNEADARGSAERTAAQTRQTYMTRIESRLQGTPLAGIKRAAGLVLDELESSYDQKLGGYTIDLQAAIKAVATDLRAPAKAAPNTPATVKRRVIVEASKKPLDAREAAFQASLREADVATERARQQNGRYR